MRLALLIAGALLSAAVAIGQPAPPAPSFDDAAGARRARGPQSAQATREFLGLGVVPDAAAAARGAPLYAGSCSGCHGEQARGGIGPSLIYSAQVLDDDHGEKLVRFLHVGRPERGMPAFDGSSDRDLTDIAEFLHAQVEAYANRGTYQNTNDILTGDAKRGAALFAATCASCHGGTAAPAGALAGVGARLRPLDLQRNLVMPVRDGHPARAVTATVTTPAGTLNGRVGRIDDFAVTVVDAAGASHTVERGPGVTVALTDPLAWHKAFAARVKDREMTDLTTYLASRK